MYRHTTQKQAQYRLQDKKMDNLRKKPQQGVKMRQIPRITRKRGIASKFVCGRSSKLVAPTNKFFISVTITYGRVTYYYFACVAVVGNGRAVRHARTQGLRGIPLPAS